MAVTDPEPMLGEGFHVLVNNVPTQITLLEPFTIAGESDDETSISHTFYLVINGEEVDRITVDDYHYEFTYTMTKKQHNYGGNSLIEITISMSADLHASLYPAILNYNDVIMPSLSESVYYWYSSLENTLKHLGIDTTNANGISSLIDMAEDL